MSKKLLAALLCFAMVLSTLAGCSKTPSGTETTLSGETEGTTAGTEEVTQGASEGETESTSNKVDGKGEVITIAIPESTSVTDYEINYVTQFLEKELNIDIEFYMLPAADADIVTKLNLMANGGDKLPDIIITTAMSDEMIYNYGVNGVLVPLNDYVENESISPNFYAIPEEDRQTMLATMTSADGNIYGLCRYEPQLWNITAHRLFINAAWLEALDLEMPTTTDQLYDVLKAFVNEDPNGNGVKDEIGVFGGVLSYGRNITNALMNSFTYFRGIGGGGKIENYLELSEDGQTVLPVITKDEFRDGLEYMYKLCSEGLLDPSIFTVDSTQFKAILNADTPVVGLVSSGSKGNWTNQDNFAQMKMIAPLTGPEGVCYTPWNASKPVMCYFVTSDAENPELCYRIGEYCYEETVSKVVRYGEEGATWSRDPEIVKGYVNAYSVAGVIDNDPTFALTHVENGIEDPWTVPNNYHWHNIGPRYAAYEDFEYASYKLGTERADTLIADIDNNLNVLNHKLYLDKGPEQVLPLLKFTAEETDEIALAINDIDSLMKTAIAEFITGERSLDDAGWQDYLDDLKSLGFDKVLDVCQAAYDRVK